MPRPSTTTIRAVKKVATDASSANAERLKKTLNPEKQRSVYLIGVGISLLAFSTVGLYGRFVEGKSKKVQEGEMTPDGQIRMFSDEEKLEHEKSSYFTRVFGSETWTSGLRK